MSDYLVRCTCGKDTRVSEWALGAPITCRACGKMLEATEKNARLIEERAAPARPAEDTALPPPPEARIAARTAPKQTGPARPTPTPVPAAPFQPQPEAPPQPTINRKNCGKCGRAFRGDWDMHHRGGLILCHICANQYRGAEEAVQPAVPAPELTPTAAAAAKVHGISLPNVEPPPPRNPYRGVLDHPVLPDPDAPTARDVEEGHSQMRRYIIVAGVCFVVFVGFMVFSDVSRPLAHITGEVGRHTPMAPELQAPANVKPPELPVSSLSSGLRSLAYILLYALEVLTTATALHFLLDWRDKLPKITLAGNLASVGLAAAVVEGLGLLMNVVPCAGLILQPLIAVYILRELYDLEWADLVMLGLFFIIQNPLVMLLRHFLTGAA